MLVEALRVLFDFRRPSARGFKAPPPRSPGVRLLDAADVEALANDIL